MTRPVLTEDRVHPAIRSKVADNHRDIVQEVQDAVARHDVVVIDIKQNPFPKKTRKMLAAHAAYRQRLREVEPSDEYDATS